MESASQGGRHRSGTRTLKGRSACHNRSSGRPVTQGMFNNPVSALPQVKAGKVRAIATTGLQRSLTTPDVPTVAESGYLGFEAGTWFAMLGPAGIPRDVVGRLSADLVRVLNLPEVRQRMAAQGVEAVPGTPEQLGATMRADLEKWTRVIRAGNIRPD